MEIGSCSAPSVPSRFPLVAPRVALEVTATDFPPASRREGQGCTGTWNRVEANSEGLLTQGATSKDKCFSGSTVKNILHSLMLSAVETLDTFAPSLFFSPSVNPGALSVLQCQQHSIEIPECSNFHPAFLDTETLLSWIA